MKPWVRIARADTPDGSELLLCQRDKEFVIRVDGYELMTSRAHSSEEALARLTAESWAAGARPTIGTDVAGSKASPRWLIGGLGMGFTLRASLDVLPAGAVVEVAELVPAVVEWNRLHLGHLADHPLRDSRVTVHVEDIAAVIRRSGSVYDAVVLDVDNGPIALSQTDNAALYAPEGLAALRRALRFGGVLSVWSAGDSREFTVRLRRCGFAPEVHSVPARGPGRSGPCHSLWVARLNDT